MSNKQNKKEKGAFFKKIIPFWSAHMKLLFLIGLIILLVPLIIDLVRPATEVTGSGGGYQVVIDDAADLLSDEEEAKLREDMKPITEYGGVAFVSNTEYASSASSLARDKFREFFGNDSD